MDIPLLGTGVALLALWAAGLPLLWLLLRGTSTYPRIGGLKADALMLVHLLLLVLAVCTLIMGTGLGS